MPRKGGESACRAPGGGAPKACCEGVAPPALEQFSIGRNTLACRKFAESRLWIVLFRSLAKAANHSLKGGLLWW